VTPTVAGADLSLRRVDIDEVTVGAIVDAAGAGGAETLTGNFLFTPADWIAFEVRNASPVATALELHLTSAAAPYQVAVAGATWSDACTGPGTEIVATNLDDELLARRPLPPAWDLHLFGAPVTHYVLSANGLLALGGAGLAAPACAEAGCWQNVAIPSAAVPNGFIAPFWDDLDRVKVCERADGQRFTIQWTGFQYLTSNTVAVQLTFVSAGTLELQYGSGALHTATGAGATVGLEDASGTAGLQLGFDTALPVAGKRLTLTPPP
jgi:hypothetical protein